MLTTMSTCANQNWKLVYKLMKVGILAQTTWTYTLTISTSCFTTTESNRLIFLLGRRLSNMELVSIRSLYLCRPLTAWLQDADYLAIAKAFKTWLVVPDVSYSRAIAFN